MDRTILLVDDDNIFRNRLAQAFTDRGFKTLQAADFDQAVKVSSQKPHLAVVDLKIPGGSGLDLLPVIKSANQQCRIVLLTGFGTINSAVQAVKEGAVNYLTKPTHADAILNALLIDEEKHSHQILPLPTLDQVEWDHIQRVLADCSGNISKAAKILGLHRRSLQRKLLKSPEKLQ